jgi:hypothetical protein
MRKNRELKITKLKIVALVIVSLIIASCVPGVGSNVRSRVGAATSGSTNVAINQGRILKDNPVILSNNSNLSSSYDLNKLLGSAVTITSNAFLQANMNCNGLTYCFEVREAKESVSALQTADGKWGFNANSAEFLQVNTFYHMNKIFDLYFANIGLSIGSAYDSFAFPTYDTAIPFSILNGDGTYSLNSQILTAFANCDVVNNASYEQATESLCFGYSGTPSAKAVRWAHDSTIIYHEAGHFFQRLQLNLRNTASVTKTQMGSLLYNEAGSIGEGLSDFFSYYVNGRTHWGEWAAGKLGASRPLSEDDPLHSPGISTDDDQRLSYPLYINYDPNNPTIPVEDIHITGMIISHYLTALTKDISSKCSMTDKESREFVMYILNETLAELGDLSSVGTVNGVAGKINMNAANSSLWYTKLNPINYRSFTQTIAKNLLNTIGNPGIARCNGSFYQRDSIEALLDNYGLLLFKTYNQYRNMTDTMTKINTAVSATNRKKSVLISKNNIILDPTTGASSAYVIDNRSQILEGVTQLQNVGLVGTLSSQTPSDFGFNNGNSKVSPGEVVAIALNLYNNSNSTIGGVEVLANDWDHANTATNTLTGSLIGRPCRFPTNMSNDQWPLSTEGGSDEANCLTVGTTSADFAPVCFMQSNESNATKWVSQTEFRDKIALDSNLCLDKTAGAKDCFIRAIKGADTAYYSKINPKSTWGQTMANPESGKAYGLEWGNVILFEVSKHIPPGTTVDCRFRVRFTNCEDCYHDSDRNNNDYYDFEYNGPRPYKVIHLQIPITD